MNKNSSGPNQVVFPVRLPAMLYEEVARLAIRTERSRCGMVRKLIADGISRYRAKLKGAIRIPKEEGITR